MNLPFAVNLANTSHSCQISLIQRDTTYSLEKLPSIRCSYAQLPFPVFYIYSIMQFLFPINIVVFIEMCCIYINRIITFSFLYTRLQMCGHCMICINHQPRYKQLVSFITVYYKCKSDHIIILRLMTTYLEINLVIRCLKSFMKTHTVVYTLSFEYFY